MDIGNSDPATKSDLGVLRTEMAAVRTELKTEIAAVRTELKIEIAAVRTELKAEISETRRSLALQLEHTQNDVREIKATMATMATKADFNRMMESVDSFAGSVKDMSRAMVLHGQALTEVQVAVKNHDGRITGLEGRSQAS